MSTNVLLNGADSATSSVALGTNVTTAMNFNYSSEYAFVEPKTGIAATLWPSDATWHPLYDHSYKEITQHLFGIEGLKVPEPQKHIMINKVKEIVIESYPRSSLSSAYLSIIVVVILFLLGLIFGASSSYYLLPGIFAILGVGFFIYSNVWAQGRGESYWTDFNSDLDSKLKTGMLPAEILKQYIGAEEKEKDRAIMARMNTHNNSSSNNFLAGALGGIASSMFR